MSKTSNLDNVKTSQENQKETLGTCTMEKD